ncbi:unnamed protein product, partial [Symbiodinium pilosum]
SVFLQAYLEHKAQRMKWRNSIPGGLLQAHREHKRLVEEYQVGLRVMHKVVLIFGEHWRRQSLKRSCQDTSADDEFSPFMFPPADGA